METVEIYRGIEIKYGEYKGRMMYKAGNKSVFNIQTARKAIDHEWYIKPFQNHHLIVTKGDTLGYTGTFPYSIGGYYDSLRYMQRLDLGNVFVMSAKLAVL